VSANKGFILGTDKVVATGFFEPQTSGPFSTAAATGNFFFGTTTAVSQDKSYISGVGTFNGIGNLTAISDLSQPATLLPDQVFTDSYTIAPSGRGTTAAGLVLYFISPSKALIMDAGSIQMGEE
jgi:hypothetical protein